MLIVGAKGFAKEVLETLHQPSELEKLVFYDDVSKDLPKKMFNKFPILKSVEEAREYFDSVDNKFALGLGNPILRKKLIIVQINRQFKG